MPDANETIKRKGKSTDCKNSVNNNSSKLRYIKLLKPTSISEKTIKWKIFCDVVLPLFTVGDNFELRLIIRSGLKSLILSLFFFNHSVSAFVYYSLVKDLSETKLLVKWLLIEGFFDPLSLLTTSDTNWYANKISDQSYEMNNFSFIFLQ